jgi:hypothetical protein
LTIRTQLIGIFYIHYIRHRFQAAPSKLPNKHFDAVSAAPAPASHLL